MKIKTQVGWTTLVAGAFSPFGEHDEIGTTAAAPDYDFGKNYRK